MRRGDRDDTWELVGRLAGTGSSEALSALLVRRGDREDTWELVRRQARAGSPEAVYALVLGSGGLDDIRELIRDLDDAAVERLATEPTNLPLWVLEPRYAPFQQDPSQTEVGQPLVPSWADRHTVELNRALIRAGPEAMVQALAGWGGFDPWAPMRGVGGPDVRGLAGRRLVMTVWRYWAPISVVQALVARWGDRDDTWELVSRLAEAGSVDALVVLVTRRGDRGDTWELVSRLAEAGSGHALLVFLARPGDREDTWELVKRLAGEGSPDALYYLLLRSVDLDDTWELVKGLDDAAVRRLVTQPRTIAQRQDPMHSDMVEALVARWGDRDDTWELVSRLAEAGSSEALWALVEVGGPQRHLEARAPPGRGGVVGRRCRP